MRFLIPKAANRCMKINFNRLKHNHGGKLLCVTHTDRPVDLERCNLEFLRGRYASPKRLPPAEPFQSLTPAAQHTPYFGEVTVWEFKNGNFETPELLAQFRPKTYKPQSVIWHRERLWVLGVSVLEVYDVNLRRVAVVNDPWLSGAHTIVPDGKGHLLMTCSTSDSVLILDDHDYSIVHAWRMPESLYGFNYPLKRTDSVVDHYVINDYQLTHINSARPWRQGILVSTLIQGAIGWFDPSGSYQELTRGFVGMHGARIDERTGRIYFSNSCRGVLTFLTHDFKVDYEVDMRSNWLHDAEQLGGDYFAVSVADRDKVDIYNVAEGKTLISLDCKKFGASTQFISYGK